jgi:hypothetical protein
MKKQKAYPMSHNCNTPQPSPKRKESGIILKRILEIATQIRCRHAKSLAIVEGVLFEVMKVS